MSGLSQFTIVVADKDNLQPPNEGVLALTGNAAGGDFRWYATFGDAVANTGWHPLTMIVTDAAGNQTTVSGSIEVKHSDLLYMGLIQPHNSPAQSNPSGGGGAPGATAGGMPIPGAAEAPVIVPPAPVAESAPAGTENPTPAAETPAQGPRNLVGMHSQSGAVNFTAGNQSATTPITNSAILWGAAASAMLGATVAEWQRKRDEEKARLVAMRNSGGGGGEDEGPGKKKSPGRTAYEKMMQHKHIIGALQAEQKEKAAQKAAAQAQILQTHNKRAERKEAILEAEMQSRSAKPQDWRPAYDAYMAQKAAEVHREGERTESTTTAKTTSSSPNPPVGTLVAIGALLTVAIVIAEIPLVLAEIGFAPSVATNPPAGIFLEAVLVSTSLALLNIEVSYWTYTYRVMKNPAIKQEFKFFPPWGL